MLYRYIDKNCPGTQPEYLVISRSTARLAALLAGEVDATSMNLHNFVAASSDELAGFHALVYYADEFPGFSTISTFMRRGLADAYPETARDLVRANLLARRRIQDQAVLTDEIAKRLEIEPGLAAHLADKFLERRMWDLNGAYTLEAIQAKIDWYAEGGDLPAGLNAADVADLSYLNAVLDEIGRQ
jgi:ABC-type nitrate/sulfonate/bicarbonate transport system substrate-binding protein